MSIFRSLFEKKVIDATALTWQAMLGSGSSKTGLSVTELTALRVTALYCCCRVITEDIGKIPLKLMREKADESKEVATDHPLHRVLSLRPNDWQTSMEWRGTMLLHALLCQGGYSFINRNERTGEVLELIPLMPGRVTPKQDAQWNLTYEVSDQAGKIATLRRDQVHSIHGMSWNGFSGLPVVSQGREAIGLAQATEETQARLHGQGARPGGIISTTAALTPEQTARIKAQFADNYSGVENAFKALLLDNGFKFEPWAMTGVDGQHLETRKFQIEEVARLFRVFPQMIGYTDKATTYGSAESFFGAHVVHTLMPWVANWEQAIARDLLTEAELREGYRPKFFLNALLRGDAAARSAFYESAVAKACWMTRNEARKLEDLNPLPGLDDLLVPMNLQGGAPKAAPDPADLAE